MPLLLTDALCVTVDSDDGVRLFDLALGVLVHELPLTSDDISCLIVGDGLLAVGAEDGKVRVYAADALDAPAVLTAHGARVDHLAFTTHADGTRGLVSACCAEGAFRAHALGDEGWDLAWTAAVDDPGDDDEPCAPVLDLDAGLAALDAGGRLLVVDLGAGELVREIDLGVDDVQSLVFADEGRLLAATSFGGALRRWEVATGDELPPIDTGRADDMLLTALPGGRVVTAPETASSLAAGHDAGLRISDARSGAVTRTLEPGRRGDFPLWTQLPGPLAVTSCFGGPVTLWSTERSEPVGRWPVDCSWDREMALWRGWLVAADADGSPVLLGPLADALEAAGLEVPPGVELPPLEEGGSAVASRAQLRVSSATSWDHAYIEDLLHNLAARGVQIDPGLTVDEIEHVERLYRFRFPPDLRDLLRLGLPRGDRFPDWRSGPEAALRERLVSPLQGLLFDVGNMAFWAPEWGERPDDVGAAARIATEAYAAAPLLVPVYAHRYLVAEPCVAGNPVLSVHQADVVHYGFDLASYFANEFQLPAPEWAATEPRTVPFWDLLIGG